MIWGVRLLPGQEARHLVSNQLHLTLASLDCRPGKTYGGSAYLLMKTASCENVICTLERGQTNQQQLDLVLQPGEEVTFKVEGNGHVYLTGYSWIVPDSCRDHLRVTDTRSIYTGLLPSLQEKPPIESQQQPSMMKRTETESELSSQTTRQVQQTWQSSSQPYNQLTPSDKGWILEEDHSPPERPATTAADEISNGHSGITEEFTTIAEQGVEPCDESMENTCTPLQNNEETSSKYDKVVLDKSGETFVKKEHTQDSHGEETSERETDGRAVDLFDVELHDESCEFGSDKVTRCNDGAECKGQSGEDVPDEKAQCVSSRGPQTEWSNEGSSSKSNVNESSVNVSDGECHYISEKESLPGHVREVENLETSHTEEPDGIFTVVVEDMNSAPTTSGNKTESMSRSTEQVLNIQVDAETDQSGKIVLYQCQICGKVLPSKDSFNTHKEMHVKGDQNTSKGQYNNEGDDNVTGKDQKDSVESSEMYQLLDNNFRNSISELNDDQSHTPGKVLHECQYCGKVVSSKSSLKVHLRLHPEHTGETERKLDESLRCQLCGKYFSNISNRRRHEKMHTNGKSFKCYVCGKQLQNKWYLNEHLRIHAEETLQKCQFCDKVFRGEGKKNQHEKMHFGATVPYVCRYCGKIFDSPSGGRRHEAMHTGNRAYKCRFCDKTFNDRRCRESHEGRVHTGEKFYKCQLCVKSFYGKSDLDVHMRVHTGEKPYKCRYCDELFTYHTSARRHEAKHVEASI